MARFGEDEPSAVSSIDALTLVRTTRPGYDSSKLGGLKMKMMSVLPAGLLCFGMVSLAFADPTNPPPTPSNEILTTDLHGYISVSASADRDQVDADLWFFTEVTDSQGQQQIQNLVLYGDDQVTCSFNGQTVSLSSTTEAHLPMVPEATYNCVFSRGPSESYAFSGHLPKFVNFSSPQSGTDFLPGQEINFAWTAVPSDTMINILVDQCHSDSNLLVWGTSSIDVPGAFTQNCDGFVAAVPFYTNHTKGQGVDIEFFADSLTPLSVQVTPPSTMPVVTQFQTTNADTRIQKLLLHSVNERLKRLFKL